MRLNFDTVRERVNSAGQGSEAMVPRKLKATLVDGDSTARVLSTTRAFRVVEVPLGVAYGPRIPVATLAIHEKECIVSIHTLRFDAVSV